MQSDVVEGQFRPGWQTGTGTHIAALHLQLAPKWKTYWRAPGDAGIPPHFDWSGSENVASVRFFWPAPDVFHTNGMQTVGYHGELMLPFEVTAKDPGKPVRLNASVELGVCKDICVPASLQLGVALPAPGQPDRAISAALNARPATGREAGLKHIACTLEPIKDGMRITARMDLPSQGKEEVVVFEAGVPGVWVSESRSGRNGRTLEAVAEMVPPSGQPFALDRGAVVVSVIGTDGRAVEIHGCPAG
ncbi:MAG: protein-disulfide reductase DsbD domain-containing protein [Paracoccaceae bacterium]